jgi:hypothetical protein
MFSEIRVAIGPSDLRKCNSVRNPFCEGSNPSTVDHFVSLWTNNDYCLCDLDLSKNYVNDTIMKISVDLFSLVSKLCGFLAFVDWCDNFSPNESNLFLDQNSNVTQIHQFPDRIVRSLSSGILMSIFEVFWNQSECLPIHFGIHEPVTFRLPTFLLAFFGI